MITIDLTPLPDQDAEPIPEPSTGGEIKYDAMAELIASGYPAKLVAQIYNYKSSSFMENPKFIEILARKSKEFVKKLQSARPEANPEHLRLVTQNTMVAETLLSQRLMLDLATGSGSVKTRELMAIARDGADRLGLQRFKTIETVVGGDVVTAGALANALATLRTAKETGN